jgi:hypothetical protein
MGEVRAVATWSAAGAEQVLHCQLLQPNETEATAVEVRLGIEVKPPSCTEREVEVAGVV